MWFLVRYADNGVDHGYANQVRANDEQGAIDIVMTRRRWSNEDCKVNYTREILSVVPFTPVDGPTNEHLYPGDHAARDSY